MVTASWRQEVAGSSSPSVAAAEWTSWHEGTTTPVVALEQTARHTTSTVGVTASTDARSSAGRRIMGVNRDRGMSLANARSHQSPRFWPIRRLGTKRWELFSGEVWTFPGLAQRAVSNPLGRRPARVRASADAGAMR